MENEMVVIEKRSGDIIVRAEELVIQNNEQYEAGVGLQKEIKGLKKEIDAVFDPIIAKAYAAHKEAKAGKAKVYDPVDKVYKIVSGKVSEFAAEEERKRMEAETKLRIAAEKKESDLREKARIAEESGNEKKAAKYEEKASEVIAPILNSTIQKISGVQKRTFWSAVVVDKNIVPLEFWDLSMSKLNARARETKGISTIPGVKFVSEMKVV